MSKLDYSRAPQIRGRWAFGRPDLAIAALLLTGVCATFSTFTKWYFQALHGKKLLAFLPSSALYQLLIERIPACVCTIGIGLLVVWSSWRFVRYPRPLILLADLAVYFVAWWIMLFVVLGNSFEAFP